MPTIRKTTDKPDQPEVSNALTVDGEHDLTDHPGLATGTIRNVGDNVRNRDSNAPSFRRPQMVRQDDK